MYIIYIVYRYTLYIYVHSNTHTISFIEMDRKTPEWLQYTLYRYTRMACEDIRKQFGYSVHQNAIMNFIFSSRRNSHLFTSKQRIYSLRQIKSVRRVFVSLFYFAGNLIECYLIFQ